MTAIERSINAITIGITEYEKMLKVPHIGPNMVMVINGQLDELRHVIKVLKDYLPIEKQDLQKAFDAGTKYGDVLKGYDEFCPDFDQFYNELKGE